MGWRLEYCWMGALISPEFATVVKIPAVKLQEQTMLQLVVMGSHSKINYGAWANINFSPITLVHTSISLTLTDTTWSWAPPSCGCTESHWSLKVMGGLWGMDATSTSSASRLRRLSVPSPFGSKGAKLLSSLQWAEPARSSIQHKQPVGMACRMDIHIPRSPALTESDISCLRECWLKEISDITGTTPLQLPLQEVNHHIELINPSLPIKHQYSKCPNTLHPLFMEKIDCYIQAGWWEEKYVPHASPLLCILKKDRRLHTIVNCCECNLNMVKDLIPFLDQDMICSDVAQAPYWTKLNMSDAYEQVWVEPRDIKNTAFSMIIGTFLSHAVQQDDCNAPATFQRLMMHIFQQCLGKFI